MGPTARAAWMPPTALREGVRLPSIQMRRSRRWRRSSPHGAPSTGGSGAVLGPEERISVDTVHAITLGAAYTLHGPSVGSIEPGKYADFAVLEARFNRPRTSQHRVGARFPAAIPSGDAAGLGMASTGDFTVIGGFLGAGKTTL